MNACPYCDLRRGRYRMAVHLAANECGLVPEGRFPPHPLDVNVCLEADWQKLVVDVAKAAGWLSCHVYPTQAKDGTWRTGTTAVGFPDLWLLRPPRLVVLELKADGKSPSAEQAEWIEALDGVPGVFSTAAWPTDWPGVCHVLRRPTC